MYFTEFGRIRIFKISNLQFACESYNIHVMQAVNPFQVILDELGVIKELVHSIKKEPELELKKKLYSIKETAEILKVDYQTVRSHILKGNIKAERIGRMYRIKHFDLMEALNDVKSLKYKR